MEKFDEEQDPINNISRLDEFRNWRKSLTHTLVTKGIGATLTYASKSLAALLSYEDTHQIGKKKGIVLDYTKGKVAGALNYAETKAAIFEKEVKNEIDTKVEKLLENREELFVLDAELSFKDSIANMREDLKNPDARISWYLDKFREAGIIFDNEDRMFRTLCMLHKEKDLKIIVWLENKLQSIVQ